MKAETSKLTEGIEVEPEVAAESESVAEFEAAELAEDWVGLPTEEVGVEVRAEDLTQAGTGNPTGGAAPLTTLGVPAAEARIGSRRAGNLKERLRVVVSRLPHFDDRVGRLILSIVLAALLWFYVGNLENPERTTVYRDLAVEVRGLAPNFKLLSQPQEVSVTVQAPQGVLATLSQADVRPYIDLGGFAPGVHTVPLRADVRGGIQMNGGSVQISPDTVQVQIEEQVTRDLPVAVRLTGTPAFGYGAEPPQANPATVRVRGIPDAVSRIESVIVNVDIEDKAGTQQGSRAPVALDGSGEPVENVTFEPQSVEVVVPIKLLLNYKVVPLRVPVPGQPAPGYRVSAITYDPTNVTVCCRPDILEPLQFIDTLPVNINGTTSTVVTQTELILPPEVELYPGQPRVISVTVNVEALVTTLQVSVAPSIEGIQAGTGFVVSPDRLDLVLAGTFDQLQRLNPSDVRAVVNLQERGPGTYTLRPQMVVPPGVTLQSADPEAVTITVLAPTPAPSSTSAPPTSIPTLAPSPSPSPRSTVAFPTQAPATPTRALTPIVSTPTQSPIASPTQTATPAAIP